MQAVFREDHQIHGAHIAPRLADHFDDAGGLRGQIGGGFHHRQLQLHRADDDAVFRFVQSAKSVHGKAPYLVMDNSPGAPLRAWLGEEVAIKTPSVST